MLQRVKKKISELLLCTFGLGAQALGPKVINGSQGLGIKIEPNEFHNERVREREKRRGRERKKERKKILQCVANTCSSSLSQATMPNMRSLKAPPPSNKSQMLNRVAPHRGRFSTNSALLSSQKEKNAVVCLWKADRPRSNDKITLMTVAYSRL